VERKISYLALLGSDSSMPLVRWLGGGLAELRVGKYRLSFVIARMEVGGRVERGILFVAYGEKGTQRRDIERARGRL
jgi:urea transporter